MRKASNKLGENGAYKPRHDNLFEKLPVLANVVAPFAGHTELIENRVHRADGLAIRTINAGDWIDIIHLRFFCRRNTVYWANIQAGRIFNPNAGFSDDVGHNNPRGVKNSNARKFT